MRQMTRMALLLAALVVLATASPAMAKGKGGASKDVQRLYYLTTAEHLPWHARNACASGFHMASLFEIVDPSALKYDISRGHTAADSGGGAPAYVPGWIRTGGEASGAYVAGLGNCNGWTEVDYFLSGGTAVWLQSPWPSNITSIWGAGVGLCTTTQRVWCVQD